MNNELEALRAEVEELRAKLAKTEDDFQRRRDMHAACVAQLVKADDENETLRAMLAERERIMRGGE
jgi:multidrug resistance efflux pump